MVLDTFLHSISRKKKIDDQNVEKSALARVLTVFDLTALGVGATLGINFILNLLLYFKFPMPK